MATKDSEYAESNARDATFTLAETAVVLWAIGGATNISAGLGHAATSAPPPPTPTPCDHGQSCTHDNGH